MTGSRVPRPRVLLRVPLVMVIWEPRFYRTTGLQLWLGPANHERLFMLWRKDVVA